MALVSSTNRLSTRRSRNAFPGITATGVYLVGPDFAGRMEPEQATGNIVADLVQSGDTAAVTAIDNGWLEKFEPVTAAGLDDKYKDDDGYVFASSATAFGIMYNTDMLDADEAPQGWEDLLDPEWKSKFIMSDPTKFGSTFSALAAILHDGRFGDDYVEDLAEQDIAFEASAPVAAAAVTSGQYPVNPIYVLSFFQRDKAAGGKVEFVFPTEGGVHLSPHYIGVVKGAPNPIAAQLLETWLFSPEGQAAQAEVGYYPLSPGAPGPSGYPPAEELDLFESFPLEDVNDILAENLVKVQAAFE